MTLGPVGIVAQALDATKAKSNRKIPFIFILHLKRMILKYVDICLIFGLDPPICGKRSRLLSHYQIKTSTSVPQKIGGSAYGMVTGFFSILSGVGSQSNIPSLYFAIFKDSSSMQHCK